MARISYVSLGCPKALVDSERILTRLRAEGYELSREHAGADLVIVNTCGFLDSAQAESLDAIGAALNENGKVVVTGCMGAEPEKITERFPNVFAITGPQVCWKRMANSVGPARVSRATASISDARCGSRRKAALQLPAHRVRIGLVRGEDVLVRDLVRRPPAHGFETGLGEIQARAFERDVRVRHGSKILSLGPPVRPIFRRCCTPRAPSVHCAFVNGPQPIVVEGPAVDGRSSRRPQKETARSRHRAL